MLQSTGVRNGRVTSWDEDHNGNEMPREHVEVPRTIPDEEGDTGMAFAWATLGFAIASFIWTIVFLIVK